MTYRVEVTGSALRDLRRVHPAQRRAIEGRIDALSGVPRPRGAVPLRGEFRGLWRLRVGEYRVIYEIDDAAGVVTVAAVGAEEASTHDLAASGPQRHRHERQTSRRTDRRVMGDG